MNDLSSDHSPIIIEIFTERKKLNVKRGFTSSQTNWLKYKKYISTHIHTDFTIQSNEQIDDAVTVLNSILIKAAENSTPMNNPVNREEYVTSIEIESLVMEKRRLRREWQQFRSPAAKLRLKEAEKSLRVVLGKETRKNNYNYISNLSPNGSKKTSLWKASKGKAPTDLENPIRKSSGEWAKSDEEKASVFAHHLSQVFKPHPPSNNLNPIYETINSQTIETEITSNEVSNVIKTLVNKKAPGFDSISNVMLKNIPFVAVIFITTLFNAIIRIGYYPSAWKKALIIMIPKPGKNPTLASSYRPISLLPCLSKLFEKLLLLKMTSFLQEHNLIPPHQFGFREKHSTIEQVNRITNEIRTAFEKREYCSAVFLDVAQAFDRVWQEGLIIKIRNFLPVNVHAILESYITERLFMVKYKSFTTSTFPICAGVPQGSVLGPFLYVLFTSDIPTSPNITTSTFADDTAILCRNKNVIISSGQLEAHLNLIKNWMSQWRIKVNEEKCRHITFTLNRQESPRVSLNGFKIPVTNDVTYLGINLDKRLTWRKHIVAKKNQIKIKLSSLHWLLNPYSPLCLEHKVLLYKQVIKPIWTYGLQLYGNASASNIEILQRCQSKILRTITGAPWFIRNESIHRDLNIALIKSEFQTSRQKYIENLNQHINPLARSLAYSERSSRLKRLDCPAAIL